MVLQIIIGIDFRVSMAKFRKRLIGHCMKNAYICKVSEEILRDVYNGRHIEEASALQGR